MKCPMCDGHGAFYETICYQGDLRTGCDMCKETGRVSFLKWLDYKLWGEWLPCKFVEWYADTFYGDKAVKK